MGAETKPELKPASKAARPTRKGASPAEGVGGLGHQLLSLQRNVGNRAVVSMLSPAPSQVIRRKAGDVSRPDYDLVNQITEFLGATDRNKLAQFPALKERMKDASVFKSPDMRKLALRFQTGTADKFGSDVKLRTSAQDLVAAVIKEFEADRKVEATALESAVDGHSVDRHGPEVTDVALQARLTTGIAPDNQISVAPGYSSKFTSYTTWLDTRQAAITKLTDAVTATQLRLIALEPRLPAAKLKETTGDAKVEAATEERRVKNVAHARASGQQGMGSPEQIAAAGELETATSSLVKATKARAATAADVDQMLTKLPLPVERSQVDLANIGSFRVKRAYRVIVDNAKAIGSGWKGTDVQAPASITHGGRTVDDAVLYTDTQATEPLTKSLTTLDGGAAAGTPLLTGASPAVPNVALNVAAWDVVQHFPAPPDAVASIE